MQRIKSFSNYGHHLDLWNSKTSANQQQLYTILHRKGVKDLVRPVKRKTQKVIQGFDKVTSREKPSSFQVWNSKDHQNNANYQVKQTLIFQRAPDYSINKQKDIRLSGLLSHEQPRQQRYQKQLDQWQKCSKHIPSDGKELLNTRQLQNDRKSFHSLDFNKQTNRPRTQRITYDSKLKNQNNNTASSFYPQRTASEFKFRKTLSQNQENKKKVYPINDNDKILKLQKVHSFDSYSRRDFLNPKKLKCAPESSGIDNFKIPLEKTRSNWHVVAPPKFQKLRNSILMKQDRDSDYWYTKLQYNVKSEKREKGITFDQQTHRKQNTVKSNYPMRLAI